MIIKFACQLMGIRIVEGIDGMRVTLPKYMVKLFPKLPAKVEQELANEPELEVRVVRRSIIARYR